MTKQLFIELLGKRLSNLPPKDVSERLNFYSEMIDDRMEDGISEEEAVAEIGDVEQIVKQTLEDIPLSRLVKERIKPRKPLSVWNVIALIIGSPIWLSLLIATFAVIFSLYVALWAVIVALWATFIACGACVLACVIAGIYFATFRWKGMPALTMAILLAMVATGLAILLYNGCTIATKGIIEGTKALARATKKLLIKKTTTSNTVAFARFYVKTNTTKQKRGERNEKKNNTEMACRCACIYYYGADTACRVDCNR